MTISSVTLSSIYVAYTGVYLTISMIYANIIASGDYLVLTFSDEFIRIDAGTPTCAEVTS
jgi:hypothetical protein